MKQPYFQIHSPRHRTLSVLLYSNYLNVFGYSLFGPLYALFITSIGGSAFHAGASWGFYMLVAGLFMLFFGKNSDNHTQYRKYILISGYFILAFGALAFVFVTQPAHVYVVQFVNAVGVGMVDPAIKALYAKMQTKGKEGEQWALMDGGDNILIAVAAFLGGICITYFSFTTLFITIFILQIIAAVLSVMLVRGAQR